jgi:hypothetical protein
MHHFYYKFLLLISILKNDYLFTYILNKITSNIHRQSIHLAPDCDETASCKLVLMKEYINKNNIRSV